MSKKRKIVTGPRKPPKRVTGKRKIGTLNVLTGRMFKMRRTSNPLRTIQDLCDWIHDASGGLDFGEPRKPWTKTSLKEAVRWMYAMDQADSMRDYSLREMAEQILNGMKPVTLAEIQTDWLDGAHGENGYDARMEIATTLESHFDVEDPYEHE
jgi:hypothetical protein